LGNTGFPLGAIHCEYCGQPIAYISCAQTQSYYELWVQIKPGCLLELDSAGHVTACVCASSRHTIS